MIKMKTRVGAFGAYKHQDHGLEKYQPRQLMGIRLSCPQGAASSAPTETRAALPDDFQKPLKPVLA